MISLAKEGIGQLVAVQKDIVRDFSAWISI